LLRVGQNEIPLFFQLFQGQKFISQDISGMPFVKKITKNEIFEYDGITGI